MKVLHAFFALGCAAGSAWAVYAPVPEFAKGRALTAVVAAAVFHDSNIFGAGENEIDSLVYRVAPSLLFNASLQDQTLVSGTYGLTADYVVDRPGKQDLYSHFLQGRLAHSFSPQTSLDVRETYSISRNPESLLAGVPVNADQSFNSNELEARLTTAASPRLGFIFFGSALALDYDNPVLADSLDRDEIELGAASSWVVQPRLKAVAEYRYLTIDYETAGQLKNKDSQFLLLGFDYAAGPKTVVTARAGAEARDRDGLPDETAPYVELSARYAYGALSYVSAGYVAAFEEPSNLALYTDTQVNRLFARVQHALRPTFLVSGSLTFEPSELQGRPGVSPDRDETVVRGGIALTYMPSRRWSASLTADWDNVDSDDPDRGYDRSRIGVSGRYQF